MTTMLFPVGHYTGVLPSAIGAPHHVVRVGTKQHRLTEDDFRAWMLAHGPVEATADPWTWRRITAEASRLDDTPEHLEGLEGRGLVLAVDADDPDLPEVARAYRLDPLLIGLGDTAEQPGYHRIGIPEVGVVAVLDPDSYELWEWAATTPSLWATCELRAIAASDDDPRKAAGRVLHDLRTVVVHGCGYLDVVR